MERALHPLRPKELRRDQTDCERRLWAMLRARRLLGLKFRRQHPIGPFIVDFCCLERRLIVELDGSQHVELNEYDERRTEYLEKRGYRVLRFWNNQIMGEIKGVLEAITLELSQGAPHPSLSPLRGER